MEKEKDKEIKNEMKILYTSFNQDYKCFLIGTEKGCTVYNSEPYKKGFELSKKKYIYFLLYRIERRIYISFDAL